MPFSSGTFSLYTPGNPVVTGTTIASTWANNTLADIATGLTSCVLKDGSQTITANLPMNSKKLTGLAAGSASGDSLRYEQLVGVYALLTQAINPNIVDAAGDLIVGTAADTATRMPAPYGGAQIINGKITLSVGAGALTVAVKTLAGVDPSPTAPVLVRVPGVTSNVLDGTYSIIAITGALSVVVSSGSTLGHASAIACPVYVYLINNAGSLELAVSTKYFSSPAVVSTTAEGGAGAADSAATMYSTSARSNVVAYCVLRWKSTQTTAGTWAATTGEQQLYPFPYKAPTRQVFTSTGGNTYTKPWEMLYAEVTVVAGGGGSGGAAATGAGQAAAGGGGGGGGTSIKRIAAESIGPTETATVGAGGTAATAGANPGGTGDTSSFGSHCSATGGGGGTGSAALGGDLYGSGASADGGSGSGGDINIKGEGAEDGIRWGVQAGGYGGRGGSSFLGGGAKANPTGGTSTGTAGGNYGGGASGGANGQNQSAAAGSAGANGIVIVDEFYA